MLDILSTPYEHSYPRIGKELEISDEWRANWTGLSGWFRSLVLEEEKRLNDPSVEEIDPVNTDLPKLPVPDLQHTMIRYLEALEPILSERNFARTKEIVDNFSAEGGDGEIIQQSLLKRQTDLQNWAYEYWLDDMYLNNPISLPINSNPGMVFPPRKFSSLSDMAKFAARLVSSAVSFKERIDKHDLPVETVVTNGVSQPLCMTQYHRIFTTYRAPGLKKDAHFRVGTHCETPDPHIIVACKEQFYVIPLRKKGQSELLTDSEIASQFLDILDDNENTKEVDRYPIGLMTHLRRDSWARIRNELRENYENRNKMRFIETCLLIVCFDLRELPSSFNSESKYNGGGFKTSTRDETHMIHQMIHGGGSAANSGNRWFDKTLQLIIGKDGVNGLCYEHSPSEGVAVINAMESMLHACDDLSDIIIDWESRMEQVKPLTWDVTPNLQEEMCLTEETVDKNVRDLDFNVFRFNGYGKNFIKSCRCSPDGFVQLALQLAYYNLHGKLCATYESASTRRFRLGRVDCIRAETMEVLRWVSNMNSRTLTVAEKLEQFDAALKKQTLITTENITGHGIDIHLLGLREMAKERKIRAEIFEDEAYTFSNQFLLSTSQVATKIDGFMGYGPVVPDGYGASYNPKNDSIIFCLSSFRSSEITSTTKFTESLAYSLNTMKDLVIGRK